MSVPYKNTKTLLSENKIPLTCIIKAKTTLPNITPSAIMEECEVIDELPDEISLVAMEDCVYDEHEYRIIKYLVEKNYTKVNDELR